MRGAHGDRQSIDLCAHDEVDGLIGIGQKLLARELALGAVAVFLFARAMLERPENAKLAFDGGADGMRRLDHAAGDIGVYIDRRPGSSHQL